MSTYDVVLLVEQPLTATDVVNVRALHEAIEDPVRYHLLLPVENAAASVEAAMVSLAGPEPLAVPMPMLDAETIKEIQQEVLDEGRQGVATCAGNLRSGGAEAECEMVTTDPIKAVVDKVKATDAAEVIVLTRPHVVAELFHQDWASKARKKLGVPVLHLIEHENFDEQAGQGEGVTGL